MCCDEEHDVVQLADWVSIKKGVSMSNQQPLTREQLANEYQWSQFPEAIQERLSAHYVTFNHAGNFQRAERDIQSATDALFWVKRGEPLAPFLKEHRRYFGEESAADLADMAEQLTAC